AGVSLWTRYAVDASYVATPNVEGQLIQVSIVDTKTASWGAGLSYSYVDTKDNLLGGEQATGRGVIGHRLDVAISYPAVPDILYVGSTLRWQQVEPRPLKHGSQDFFEADAGALFKAG